MARSIASALVLPAAAALVLAAGCTTTVPGTASADSAAPAPAGGDAVAWVDEVCGSLLPFVRATSSPPDPSQARDPAGLVRMISSYLRDGEDAARTAISGMEAAGPSPVAGGDEVVTRLSGTLETFQTSFRKVRTRIEQVDVDDRQALLTEVPAAVRELEQVATMPNPLADLQASPELDRAAREAASCQQIAREFGR